MTTEEILAMFRKQASILDKDCPEQNDLILELAELLADSRGRLSKENFSTLVGIGAGLYKEGHSQYQARSDINAIMSLSVEHQKPN
jgi:hypothetical protein